MMLRPFFVALCLVGLSGLSFLHAAPRGEPTRDWAVQLAAGIDPDAVAARYGAVNLGNVGPLTDTWLFRFPTVEAALTTPLAAADDRFKAQGVRWREHQHTLIMAPQQVVGNPFDDPEVPAQWHLWHTGQGNGRPGEDANVFPAWERGYSGAGVGVAVVDSGFDTGHPDLVGNLRLDWSYDYLTGDSSPMPDRDIDGHGTSVGGIIGSVDNQIGGTGIAYNAQLAAIRLIDGPNEDNYDRIGASAASFANGLSQARNEIAIYNNSWGPGKREDDPIGAYFSDMSALIERTLEENVRFGRNGLGNIYVFSAGNGQEDGENSNYASYTRSRYTITVGSVGHKGVQADYSEPGANLHISAPSNGNGWGIVTADVRGEAGYSDTDVTTTFGGTSAAAPVVSGVIALMLEANPNLTWRDVQHILARTAVQVDLADDDWVINAGGRHHNHKYGFGRIDAQAAVRLAEVWTSVGAETVWSRSVTTNRQIPENSQSGLQSAVEVDAGLRLEHVEVDVDYNHSDWGDLLVALVAPSGTTSILHEPHNSLGGPYDQWTYMSTRHWDEPSDGVWTLVVFDQVAGTVGTLQRWSLRLYGTVDNTPRNRAPNVLPQTDRTPGEVLEVGLQGLATDPDGDAVELISVYRPGFGVLDALTGDQVRYTPFPEGRAIDRIGLTYMDARGEIGQGFVEIINTLPLAVDDQIVLAPGESVLLPVTANDEDLENDVLALAAVGVAAQGTAVTEAGQMRYTAPVGFSGIDRFTYTVTDNKDGEDTGEVAVIVTPGADAALAFDGVDNRVRVADAPALQLRSDLAIDAWIKPTGWGENGSVGFGRIVDKGAYLLYLNGSNHATYVDRSLLLGLRLPDGSLAAYNTPAGSMELGVWQHVAASYDASTGTVRVTIDGVAQALTTPFATASGTLGGSFGDDLMIGESAGGDRAFAGVIDDLRLWQRSFTEGELAGLRNQAIDPAANGLVAAWNFDEGRGGLLGDVTGQDHDGVVVGASWRDRDGVTEATESYWGYTTARSGGTWEVAWLGPIFADYFPWVRHSAHGWLLASGAGGNGAYVFWDDVLGWVSTRPGVYPFFYRFSAANWIFYLEGSASPRQFYSYAQGTWITVD